MDEETGAREVRALELVEGTLRAGDTARYEYRARDGVPFVAALTAATGPVRLSIVDSAGASVVSQVGAGGNPPFLPSATSEVVTPVASATYTLVVTGVGSYGVRILATTPETAAARLVVNDTIRESLDATGDVDVFSFVAAPGEFYVGYLQLIDGGGTSATLQLQVDGYTIAWAATAGSSELESQSTDRFFSTVTDTARVTIRGDYVGPYRLMIRRIDRGPETARAEVTPNDTLETERLDYVGDIDEFTIRGAPGTRYTVMLQLTTSDSTQRARLEIWEDHDPLDPVASRFVAGNSPSLVSGAAQPFLLDASGTATVIVRASGRTRTPYRLFVYRVDPLPEHIASRLSPGDSVVGEDLELPGDIDEFSLTLATDDTLLFLAYLSSAPRPPDLARGVVMTLLDSAGTPVGGGGIEAWDWISSGTRVLPRGRYRVRVEATGVEAHTLCQYRIAVHRLRSAPEEWPRDIAIGDTISGIINPVGDVDAYRFQGLKGDHLDLEMESTSGQGGLYALIAREGSDWVTGVEGGSSLSEPNIHRFTLPESGTYLLRAQSSSAGAEINERGPYRLLIKRLSGAPEHHAAELALGDTVSNEGIETPGDVDEFFVHGAPGSEFTALFNAGEATYGLDVQLVDATTKDVLSYTSNQANPGEYTPLGRITLPPSRRLMLRVQERGGRPQVARTAPYTLIVYAINRRPETLPVGFAIGDTVSGELIDPVEDIDEFEFTGVQGERLLALVTAAVGSAKDLAFQVFEASTGRLVAAARVDHPNGELGLDRSQPFTLPSTGKYLVRVQWPFANVGAYKFLMQRQ